MVIGLHLLTYLYERWSSIGLVMNKKYFLSGALSLFFPFILYTTEDVNESSAFLGAAFV